jgi:hypothetical protein
MDSLITAIVVLIVSAIGTWIKKRTEKKQEEPDAPPLQPGQPRPTPGAPQQRPVTWEDELRRLLGDEEPVITPPKPPVAPRPVAPKPAPPPIVARPIPPPATSAPRKPLTAAPPPIVPRVITPVAVAEPKTPVQPLLTRAMSKLATAQQAEERVRELPSEHIVPLTSVQKRTQPSRETTEAISLFKNARATREAMIVSIVLGPPKALEEN